MILLKTREVTNLESSTLHRGKSLASLNITSQQKETCSVSARLELSHGLLFFTKEGHVFIVLLEKD